ncbi:hypothetical protein NO559_09300 [Dasania sp. GY-MA-18]|uniref:DUF4239 domain-containing protein n=1 Tax=Dasania phycosphaerae TaxID=2950436 RepID=A0A9J6RMJ6_9GAMM|nr:MULTISPECIES: hypothetical protein [Dasania]MCR8922968.1 hypothetical protein [Dasania sp. GY-MA-18]MCZ0865399.1 hypothetical protein [Dasania phycosphaerae]MCZ0869124.1 hypothetical protein [Dasania phycosphaerae]
MDQQEFLYNHNSIVITLVLFALIILFNEVSFRIGRYVQHRTNAELKSLTGSVQASILGLLALLLGFTFSMAMQRFDNRNLALIDEANAIGTTVLRVHLLASSYRSDTYHTLDQYIDLRIAQGKTDLSQTETRAQYNEQLTTLQYELWELATLAASTDPRPTTTGAYINALNAMFDAQSKRNALLQMHVPEVVLLLLFIVFIASLGIMGYSSGLSNKRLAIPTVLIAFLIAMIVFIIIDLDRPKRGLIQVNQAMMLELKGLMATSLLKDT